MVQLNTYNSKQLSYLHLPSLKSALEKDPDLFELPRDVIMQVFQTLYVCTGCDYTSFFKGIGKITFLRYFYQYAAFITSGKETTPGTLADTDSVDKGYLAFMRLIGTVYFKKYNTAFETSNPQTHFNRFSEAHTNAYQHHQYWLDNIRESVWERVEDESEVIPTNDALYRHWRRTCWVVDMWHQSSQQELHLQPLTEFGWKMIGEELVCDWDSDKNVATVRERVHALTTGCHCKTGCLSAKCSCKKRRKCCTGGCECLNCSNREEEKRGDELLISASVEEEGVENSDEELMQEVEKTMQMVFGVA